MAQFDYLVTSETLLAATAAARATFTVPLVVSLGDGDMGSNEVRSYNTAAEVAADADLTEEQAAAATAMFGQSPKPALVKVGKTARITAHRVTFTITANDGTEYTVTLDGVDYSYTAGVGETAEDIAGGLKTAIGAAFADVSVASATTLVVTRDPPFTASSSVDAGGAITTAITTQGTYAADVLDGLLAADDEWFGFVITSRRRVDIASAAAWSAVNDRLFVAQNGDTDTLDAASDDDTAEDLAAIETAAYVYHDTDADRLDAAWLGRQLSVDPDLRSTIWAFAPIAGGIDTVDLTATQRTALLGKNGNCLGSFMGVAGMQRGTSGSGRKLDLVVARLWLRARVRESIGQAFLDAAALGSKVPYTEAGLAIIRDRVQRILDIAVEAGHGVAGTARIDIPAFDELTDLQRSSRVVPVTYGIEPAGAIESADVLGYLTEDFSIAFT